MIKVTIVDDHHLFRLGLECAIKQMNLPIEVICEAECGDVFLRQLAGGMIPDIVLLDIIMPGLSGVDLVQILRRDYQQVKILMLSAECDKHTIVQLTQTGIDGYISKSATRKELETAIDYISNDGEYFGDDIAHIIHNIRIAKNEEVELTPREREIVELCAQGLAAKEIADRLCISMWTVVNHKRNIMQKLGFHNNAEIVRYALDCGIITNM
jgi:DNA-binding NarL/FixJ family response regulator